MSKSQQSTFLLWGMGLGAVSALLFAPKGRLPDPQEDCRQSYARPKVPSLAVFGRSAGSASFSEEGQRSGERTSGGFRYPKKSVSPLALLNRGSFCA